MAAHRYMIFECLVLRRAVRSRFHVWSHKSFPFLH